MLLTAGQLPRGGQWLFQPKWDGVRATVRVGHDGGLTVCSRSGRVITAQLPELAGLPDAVGRPLLLDGELVVLGRDGRPDFDAVRYRLFSQRPSPSVNFMAFDVLELDRALLLRRPQVERRALLEDLQLTGTAWHTTPTYQDGEALWQATADLLLEGVVAKRANAIYRPGQRTPAWRKVKHRYRSRVQLVGYLPRGDGLPQRLVMASEHDGQLVYAGMVELGVGPALRRLIAARTRSSTKPCELRNARWVEPVAAVVHHGPPTGTGRLREPVLDSITHPD